VSDFIPLPATERILIAWPTPNHNLVSAPDKFFARTRANPDYGKPGWTRDCGKRLHRGCDIAPVHVTPTGTTTRVIFTNCATGQDYESVEPTFVPHDDVFCVFDGIVEKVDHEQDASDFGCHVIVAHRWPVSGNPFFTLYAHLAAVDVSAAQSLAAGTRLGRMGQTSRNADARNWMAIAPHLHFEVRADDARHHDPAGFLTTFAPRI
jgi:murein DD-endopeptidase MepM/ murein hydrolase activator NlpD